MDDKRTFVWFGAFVIVLMLIGVASGILLDRFLIRPPGSRPGWGAVLVPGLSSACRRWGCGRAPAARRQGRGRCARVSKTGSPGSST